MERLTLEHVKIIFANFRGEKGVYNAEGQRSFSVLITDFDLAEELISEGWALKPLKGEDDEIEAYHLPVKVNYGGRRPPRIYKLSMSTNQMVPLNEKTVNMLDYLPIEYADVILNPYQWEVRGDTGVKAYCHSMFAVIEETSLDIKYAGLSLNLPFDEED